MKFLMVMITIGVLGSAAAPVRGEEKSAMWMYIGTSSGKKSEGIYVVGLDAATGKFAGAPQLAAKARRATFLAIHPQQRWLYAVDEVENADGMKTGAVMAYDIDATTGMLREKNHQSSGGKGPCFVSIDQAGKNALVANYSSGVVAVLPIGDDGTLRPPSAVVQHEGKGKDPKRQEGPHAHSFYNDPTGQWALAADLGIDKVMISKLDAEKGTLTAQGSGDVPAGAGPRHLAFGKGGKFCYVINELASTVTVFGWDAAAGKLENLQTVSALPEGVATKTYSAEILLHPSGRYLYASNRGHDSIAVFTIDEASGKIALKGNVPCGGKWPRNFGIDPTGRWLVVAHERSDSVTVFDIDAATGNLRQTGEKIEVGSPMCVRFLLR
ncbi:MAG TPA: lactonase family protein [Tepidisphaeraceae bacterium]